MNAQPASMAGPSLLDPERLAALSPERFQRATPYPWAALEGIATDGAFERLRENLPPLSMMAASFGHQRAHGQQPHDRYVLEYSRDLPVAGVWHDLVAELDGPVYRSWLTRLLGTPRFRLAYHWHYTPRGCSVSPHCDAPHKLGSHIFYFNTDDDWHPDWGGETLILDDRGRFRRSSAPAFEDFPQRHSGPALGNRSLLFQRRGNSWHGVEPLRCPEGHLRKVFIVVINADGPLARLRRRAAQRVKAARRAAGAGKPAGGTGPR